QGYAPTHESRARPDSTGTGRGLAGQLVGNHTELVDLRRLCEQFAGLRLLHQRRRHLAVEVRVAPGFVVERIENGESRRSLLDGEPGFRGRFGVHQGESGPQEVGDLLLLTRLRLEWDIERVFGHDILLCERFSRAIGRFEQKVVSRTYVN